MRRFLTIIIELLLPARRTDTLVRELSLGTLRILAAKEGDGTLPYHDPRVTALIWEVKYYRNERALRLGSAILSDILLDAAQESLGTPLLIPIPMHAARLRERGYNQTEALCGKVLREAAEFFEYQPRALLRMRDTPRQQGLTRAMRLKNLEGSMRARADVKGRACVVVDDVTTTGATFAEAKRALLAEGASSVSCVALARS